MCEESMNEFGHPFLQARVGRRLQQPLALISYR